MSRCNEGTCVNLIYIYSSSVCVCVHQIIIWLNSLQCVCIVEIDITFIKLQGWEKSSKSDIRSKLWEIKLLKICPLNAKRIKRMLKAAVIGSVFPHLVG